MEIQSATVQNESRQCAEAISNSYSLLAQGRDPYSQQQSLGTYLSLPELLCRCSSAEARSIIPQEIASTYSILPLAINSTSSGDTIFHVLLPADNLSSTLHYLKFYTGFEIVYEIAEHDEIQQAIEIAYSSSVLKLKQINLQLLDKDIEQGVIPDLLEELVYHALAQRASDIYLEPQQETTTIRYRIDGVLREDSIIKLSTRASSLLFRRIKIVAQMDSINTLRPDDGSFSLKRRGTDVRVRVSSLPTPNGEHLVLRILDHAILDRIDRNHSALTELGMTAEQYKLLLGHLAQTQGLILIAGPTGCGKSTLLHAAISKLANGTRHIMTIENPVERILPHVTHTEIRHDLGLGFSELLKAILRQDPDIISVGEIRERDVALTAAQAALSGHLVLSTIHASDSVQALIRLQELLEEKSLLNSTLNLLGSVRLLPRNCLHCKEKFSAGEMLASIYNCSRDAVLEIGRGCEVCNQTGVLGRVGVFEFLPITCELRQVLEKQIAESELREKIHAAGFIPLWQRARELVLTGVVHPVMAVRVMGLRADS